MINFSLIISFMPVLLLALGQTLAVTACSLVVGFSLGTLFGLVQARGPRSLAFAVNVYATLFRGTPMLVQIAFIFFFLPTLGIALSSFSAAALAIGLNSAAYVSQIVRSGVNGVSQEELDAAQVLGFSSLQTALFLVLPQALRNVLPSLTNECITLLKDSSLASTIGVHEVYKESRGLLNQSYDVVTVFFMIAAVYLLLTSIIAGLSHFLEKKLRYQ